MPAGRKILVVDDEPHQREILGKFLESRGFEPISAESGARALEALSREDGIGLVLTDLSMPGMDGIELMRRARDKRPELDFILITAHATVESAIRALKSGAQDYLLKPVELEELDLRIRKLADHRELERKAERLEIENRRLRDVVKPVGSSPLMRALLDEIGRVARTDATVLLLGETGVGKEVAARWVHQSSAREKGPFVAVNCTAIPENLLESEFFGHEKGAFTGADRRNTGLFERADGGTLFLDEIGEMDLKLQPKILRAIEERRIRRVAGTADIPVDIRLIAATHRDLKAKVAEGAFREDLFYRLNVVQIRVPPLRERTEDIPVLVKSLVERLSKPMNARVSEIGKDYVEALQRYSFPGNVRELSNVVERSLIYMSGSRLGAECLPADLRGSPATAAARGEAEPVGAVASVPPVLVEPPPGASSLADLASQYEKRLIESALARNAGDVDAVAKELHVAKSTLYSKISKHGIR